MTTTTKPDTWRVHRDAAEAAALFPVGTEVRHLNPELSAWRGKVTTDSRGRHLDYSTAPGGMTLVRIMWTTGTVSPDERPYATGFYNAGAIEPAT